jgi:hypothetical protein
MKVFICVLSAQTCTNYKLLTMAQKQTCFKSVHPQIAGIKFYYGKPIRQHSEYDWYLNCPDDTANIGHKTIQAFEMALKYEWDYLFRPNSSLYVNQNKLIEWLSDKPTTKFASGINGISPEGILYIHGSGYILSRDVVELVIKNKLLWNHRLIDDVAISDLMTKLGIIFDRNFIATGIQIKGGRFDWWQNNKCLVTMGAVDKFEQMTFLKDHFHFRVNNAPDRHKDIKLMRLLNDYLK